MLKIARAALFAMVPGELLLAILLASGVSLPDPLIVVAESAVMAVFILEVAVAYRLFRAGRRGGADRRAAFWATAGQLVPEQVRRIMAFDLKGMISLFLWVTRRREGVAPDATAVPYSGGQTATMTLFLFAMVVELVGAEVLLRALGAPVGLSIVILVANLYSIVFVLAVIAACITRPHVISADELRIRYGVFFDLRVHRDQIASVRLVRNFNESGVIKLEDARLSVAVSSQTNMMIELTQPVTVVRPLGRRAQARTIRFFADTPRAALDMLQPRREHALES
jgi:hypothetical protein